MHSSEASDMTPEIVAKLDNIQADLTALIAAHNDVVDRVNTVLTNVEPHLASIGPMIDTLSSHPLMRMLGIK